MGVHIFTKIKNTDGWNKKKNVFFSYFTSVIPEFSYMDFFRKCSMFRRSIPLSNLSFLLVQIQNAPNIQYAPIETSKNVGPLLGKVLISPSSIREDAKQKPITEKTQFEETFTKHKILHQP